MKNHAKEVANAMYESLVAANTAKSLHNMSKIERRMIKAEKEEQKKRYDEQKGLTKHQNINDSDNGTSAYHSSNSESNSTDEEKKEEKLEDIFEKNEIQIHEMLAEAVANRGDMDEELKHQLELDK